MASFSVKVEHDLGEERCREALHGLLQRMLERHKDLLSKADQSWTGNRLDFALAAKGLSVSGAMTVEPSQVTVTGDCPWIAKGKIESTLREELRCALAG